MALRYAAAARGRWLARAAAAACRRCLLPRPFLSTPLLPSLAEPQDNLCTQGQPTTAGSRQLEGYTPPYDATAVARLRAAGAVLLGKTNMDEFGMGSSCENSGFQVGAAGVVQGR